MCVGVDRCTSNHNIRYTLPEVRYQMPWEIREDSYFQLGSNFMEDFMEEGASDPGRQNMQDGGSVPKKRDFQPSRPNGAAFFPPVPSFSLLSLSLVFPSPSLALSLSPPFLPLSPSLLVWILFHLLTLLFLLLLLFTFSLLPPLPLLLLPPFLLP